MPGDVVDEINAVLVPAAKVSGRITDAITGAPLPDVAACVFGVLTGFIGECGETNTDGHYTIAGVAAGLYRVRLFTNDPYPPAWYTGSVCAEEPAVITASAGQETTNIDVHLFPNPFFPDCSQPAPPRPAPRLFDILDVWSRADGSVAVKLRYYRPGSLSLVARTRVRSKHARRALVVGRKSTDLPGGGTRTFKLGLNGRGRALRRERGRLQAQLTITLAPKQVDPRSVVEAALFRAPRGG